MAVLVGLCASPATAALTLFDDFDDYAVGNGSPGQRLADVTGGLWQQLPGSSGFADIQSKGGGDHFFAYGNSGFHGGYRDSGFSFADATIGNLVYFQMRAPSGATVNASFGVAASASPIWFDDYRAQVVLDGNSTSGYQILGRDNAGFSTLQTGLVSNVWYDITFDINTLTDTYDVYLDADQNPLTLGAQIGAGLRFRNQGGAAVAEGLESLFGFAGGGNETGNIDNIYLMQGGGNAEPEPMVLEVNTNGVTRIHNPSALDIKQFNYYEIHSLAGSLDGAWSGIDGDAPASEYTWEQGQAAVGPTLLVEASLFGDVALEPSGRVSIGTAYSGGEDVAKQDLKFYYGLVGGTTLYEGDVVFVTGTPGDFNDDGQVDSADYTRWRDHLGAAEDGVVLAGNGTGGTVDLSDLQLWRTHFGGQMAAGTAIGNTEVPEPYAFSVAFLAMGAVLNGRLWTRTLWRYRITDTSLKHLGCVVIASTACRAAGRLPASARR